MARLTNCARRSEEETEAYCDADNTEKLGKKRITADARPKADVEPDTKEKLAAIVALWNEQSRANKKAKADRQALTDATVDAIERLTDEDAARLLHLKWIEPVCRGIDNTLQAVLADFESRVQAIDKKYAVSYRQVNDDLEASRSELAELVGQLTGDEFAIEGLSALIKD